MSGKRSSTAYKSLWGTVIEPALKRFECREIHLRDSAKSDIWRAYVAFNRHASETYMADSKGLLDRHKVAACYTYAILMAMPLVVEGEHVDDHLNERVALHVGCSVLASFLTQAVKQSPGFDDETRGLACRRIAEGVRFPYPVGHGGTYVDSILNCLAFTQMEQNYNILSLALLYYDWELWIMDSKYHDLVIQYYSDKHN